MMSELPTDVSVNARRSSSCQGVGRPGKPCLLTLASAATVLTLLLGRCTDSGAARAQTARSAATPSRLPSSGLRLERGLSYSLEVVQFESPRRMSTGAGVQLVHGVIEVVIRGTGLEGAALTPVLFLNGYRSERTHVAPAGHQLLGWFYGVSLQELSQAAAQQNGWSLLLAPRPGAPPTIRISPHLSGAAPAGRPDIHFSTR